MFSRSKRTRVEKYLYKACLSYFAGCPSGSLPPAHFTLQRGRKQQKVGANDNGATHRGLLGGLCQELQHLHRLWHTEGPAPGCQMCTHTYVCHCWFSCGSRQRLGFWSWKGDRFITKHRIRSSRAGAWIDKGSFLLAFLSSYLLGPLRHLVTTALVTVSGFYPHSVLIICLDTVFLHVWSLLKHQKQERIWEM